MNCDRIAKGIGNLAVGFLLWCSMMIISWIALDENQARADIYSDLADSTSAANGDGLIATKQPFTGAAARTLHAKVSETLSAEDFGALGNGSADDTTAVQNALNAAAPNGTVLLAKGGRYKILSDITFPDGVTLKGAGFTCGTNGAYDASYYGARGSVILLASTAKIKMAAASCLSDLYILRNGITFPAANSSAFAGTAIDIDASTGFAKTDVILNNLLIIGFQKAVYGAYCPRLVAVNVNFDCISGFDINNAGDPVRIDKCHGWPFATVAYTPFSEAANRRAGTAYFFGTNADAGKVTNSFSFGYATGFRVSNANGVHFVNCGADNFYSGTTSSGFIIEGASDHVGLFGCQIVAQESGVIVNMDTDTKAITVSGCLIGANTLNNISILKGGVNASACMFYAAQRAVNVSNVNARLHMSGCYVQSGLTNEIVANGSNSPYVQIDADNYFRDAGVPVYSGGGGLPSVASASTVNLPKSGDVILVTGTTNIFGLTGGWPGRRVTLKFNGILTLSDAAGMNMAGNFTTTSNATITFIFTSATQAYEVCRSAN